MVPKAYPPVAVVLCAGASRRMGSPKGLLPLRGVPLLRRQVDALAARASLVIAVLGREADAHAAVLPPAVRVVVNDAWATTAMADSLRLALVSADVRGAALVTPVDVAPAAVETLDALLAAGPPAVPCDAEGRPGHPVLLDAAAVEAIRASPPEGGLRTLLAAARRVGVADPWVALDFDDPPSWRAFERGWGGG